MNLQKLFKAQKQLDDHIVKEKGLEGRDLLDKKILALQVELGELANEWEMFKFWKDDPQPITKRLRAGKEHHYYNPLLEEYVDCLHFILSIGNDIGIYHEINIYESKYPDIVFRFNAIFSYVSDLGIAIKNGTYRQDIPQVIYRRLIPWFVGLGKFLGFTWEQIEQAYFEKNKINFERQANGY